MDGFMDTVIRGSPRCGVTGQARRSRKKQNLQKSKSLKSLWTAWMRPTSVFFVFPAPFHVLLFMYPVTSCPGGTSSSVTRDKKISLYFLPLCWCCGCWYWHRVFCCASRSRSTVIIVLWQSKRGEVSSGEVVDYQDESEVDADVKAESAGVSSWSIPGMHYFITPRGLA